MTSAPFLDLRQLRIVRLASVVQNAARFVRARAIFRDDAKRRRQMRVATDQLDKPSFRVSALALAPIAADNDGFARIVPRSHLIPSFLLSVRFCTQPELKTFTLRH